jgi:hypothetical protein
LSSAYRDGTFRLSHANYAVDTERKVITVTAQAYSYYGCWCAPVVSTFTRTIDLGMLPIGEYRVLEKDAMGRIRQETQLPIAPSPSSAADDYLYAPVISARVEHSAQGNELVLNGRLSSDCLELQEIKIMNRRPHIIEVLPMAAYKTGSQCRSAERPFEVRAKLPTMEPGNTLIHVRALNGQAINLVELL